MRHLMQILILNLPPSTSLHSDTCSIKENNVNIESLKEKKLVLLADEAHHFSQKKDTDEPNWENTVDRLLQNNKDNILVRIYCHCSTWRRKNKR